MFSKSLFKQSCKASGTMWTIITFAVCFMLCCVMMIAGGSNLTMTKDAIQDTIIQGEMESKIQERSLNYYIVADTALAHFDETLLRESEEQKQNGELAQIYIREYTAAVTAGKSEEEAEKIARGIALRYASEQAYKNTIVEMQNYAARLAQEQNFAPDSNQAMELKGIIFTVLNPMTAPDQYLFDSFYKILGEETPRYDVDSLLTSDPSARTAYRRNYASVNSVVFLSGNLIQKENIDKILQELSDYGVTEEKYNEFGFNNYEKVKEIATTGLVNFRANFEYRIEHMKDGETEESIRQELIRTTTQSLLASLPHEVAEALDEIGQADLYGTLVGSIFFKMAGLLLPIIYLIMTANALIAGQVDSGSMAYILSSSIKRRTVVFTQAVYLVGSLFAMFTCTYLTSIVCLSIVNVETTLTYSKLLIINLGAFLVLFAMSGICFLTSCWFNRSKRSMSVGGGLNMFFLVATMLGLFGSPILPSILRMEALNVFNYVSIISLFDVVSILECGTAFIWKLAILLVIGIVCYAIGGEKFVRKDLPL